VTRFPVRHLNHVKLELSAMRVKASLVSRHMIRERVRHLEELVAHLETKRTRSKHRIA
jgi:hypothetical protein